MITRLTGTSSSGLTMFLKITGRVSVASASAGRFTYSMSTCGSAALNSPMSGRPVGMLASRASVASTKPSLTAPSLSSLFPSSVMTAVESAASRFTKMASGCRSSGIFIVCVLSLLVGTGIRLTRSLCLVEREHFGSRRTVCDKNVHVAPAQRAEQRLYLGRAARYAEPHGNSEEVLARDADQPVVVVVRDGLAVHVKVQPAGIPDRASSNERVQFLGCEVPALDEAGGFRRGAANAHQHHITAAAHLKPLLNAPRTAQALRQFLRLDDEGGGQVRGIAAQRICHPLHQRSPVIGQDVRAERTCKLHHPRNTQIGVFDGVHRCSDCGAECQAEDGGW